MRETRAKQWDTRPGQNYPHSNNRRPRIAIIKRGQRHRCRGWCLVDQRDARIYHWSGGTNCRAELAIGSASKRNRGWKWHLDIDALKYAWQRYLDHVKPINAPEYHSLAWGLDELASKRPKSNLRNEEKVW